MVFFRRTWVLLSVAFSFGLGASGVWAADLATISGSPDGTQSFVSSMVVERLAFGFINPERDFTTRMYSVLSRRGVTTSASVEILDSRLSTTLAQFLQGIAAAASRAPVVFTNLGPVDERICAEMARFPMTAFVVVSGNSGVYLDPALQPSCLARNILRVAALNQYVGALEPFANWGPLVRIAAASRMIWNIGPGGIARRDSNSTMGASLVAGRLASYARLNPALRGAPLIDAFLATHTTPLASLNGRVEGARALADSGE